MSRVTLQKNILFWLFFLVIGFGIVMLIKVDKLKIFIFLFGVSIIFYFLCLFIESYLDNGDNKKENKVLFSDKEIDSLDNRFIDKMENIVLNINEFFSIGIFGRWGLGKTSFLMSLKNRLDGKCEVVYINVWKLTNTSTIIKEIEKEFDNIIAKNNPLLWFFYHLKTIFMNNYFSLLNKSVLQVDNFDIRFNPTIKEAKKDFESFLNKSTNKIVLMVDEIDRLNDKDEILNIFKVIRYVSSFDNVIVITTFDKDKLAKQVDDVDFIHKIFTLKFELPKIDEETIFRDFMAKAKNKFDKKICERLKIFLELDIESKEFDPHKDKIFLKDYITTHREVKNILNDLIVFFEMINKKDIGDYLKYLEFVFALILLKNLEIDLYYKLMENREYIEKIFFDNYDEDEKLKKIIFEILDKKDNKAIGEIEYDFFSDDRKFMLLFLFIKYTEKESYGLSIDNCLYVYETYKLPTKEQK